MASRHVIESLEFAVDFPGEEQAFDTQTRLSDFLHRSAREVIAPVFDEFSDADECLLLEQLEVDLGEVDLADMEAQWQDRLRERLRESLREALQRAAQADSASPVISMSRRQAQLDAFTAFLVSGHLSWRVPDGNVTRLAGAVAGESGQALATWLRGVPAAQRTQILARLVAHLADRELRQILERLSQSLSAQCLAELQSFLAAALQSGGTGYAQRRRLVWETLMSGLLASNQTEAAEEQLQAALTKLFDHEALTGSLPTYAGLPDSPGSAKRQRSPSRRRQADAARKAASSPVHSAVHWARLRRQFFAALTQEERARIAELWQELLRAAPAYLRESLVRQGQAAEIRRRIAREFSEPMLLDLVSLFVPTERRFIELAIAHTDEVAQEHAERAPQGLKTHLWEFTLAHLLVDRGSAFNRRSYMGGLLQAVAIREGIDYRDLLQSMITALQVSGVTTGLQKQLLQLLAELQEIQEQSLQLLAADAGAPAVAALRREAEPLQEPGLSRRQFSERLADGDLRAIGPVWRRVRLYDNEWTQTEVRRQGQSSLLRHRLADGLPEPILCELAELLAPREGEFIAAAIHTVAPLTVKEMADAREIGAVRRELWEFTLSYLLADRGSGFNKRSYMGSVLQQMAARESMHYADLVDAVRIALEKVARPGALHKQMLALIAELGSVPAMTAPEPGVADSLSNAGAGHAELNAKLRAELRTELTLALSDASGRTWQQLWTQWQARAPGLLREEILRAGRTPWQRRRLVETLSENLRPALLALLLPQEGEFIATAIKDSVSALARLSNPASSNSTGADDPARQSSRLWEFSLTFALTDQGGSFNRRSYAAYLLQKIAARDGLQYRDLLRKLTGALQALPATQVARGGLLQVLLELGQSESLATAPNASGDSAVQASNADHQTIAVRLRALLHQTPEQLQRWTPQQSRELLSLAESIKVQAAPEACRALESLLLQRAAAERLVAELPPSLLAAVLYRLRPADHYAAQRCAEYLVRICRQHLHSDEAGLIARLESLQWRFLLLYFFEERRAFSVTDFVRRFADYLAAQLQRPAATEWADGLLSRAATPVEGANAEWAAAIAVVLRTGARTSSNQNVGSAPGSADKGSAASHKPPENEPIYIGNAGLVILAPYFPRLFEMLGYTANAVFVSDIARHRAMLACQYAATGNDHAEEADLVLNKLLCGVEIAAPFMSELHLEAAEKSAVDGLLQSVIAHWTALGSTSIAGLRGAFLYREGRLLPKSEDWELLVEPRGFDMLLDRLPWGFATIKYSWMPGMIHVNWR